MAQSDPEKQRAFAVDVVRRLRAAGYESYWAGGCVRDQLLGRASKDYDVATGAQPEQIRAVFGHRRTIPVGAAFGVITVLGPPGAGQIEVATFRQDAAYSDGRHPDAVRFSTPREDAQRRDFTINGLFFDPIENKVIDFVGGQDDLARGILRAIGEPRVRFGEDKLRLLRAARFAASLDLTIDPATRSAVEELARDVTVVSAERIAAEMRHILIHSHRARGATLLHELGLLEVVLPEMASVGTGAELTPTGRPLDASWVITLNMLAVLEEPTFPLALATLVHAFVDPPSAEAVCQRWKLAIREMRRVRWLLAHQNALLHARAMRWPALQRLLVSDGIEELLAFHRAAAVAEQRDLADVEHAREMLSLPANELDPAPLLTGDDLIAHSVPRGRQYQRLLEEVRDAQLEKRIGTKDEALALVDRLRAEESKGERDG